jgi:hypothetical protein
MTVPEIFIVGAPKAGTTSLASWLAQHPDVYFSVPKEPFYWAADYPRLRKHYGFETLESYEGLFASPEAREAQVCAEGSTVYLYSERAILDILASAVHPRFIVALREPVDLLVAYHRTQLVALNESEPDFATAWRRSLMGIGPDTTPLDPKLVDYPRVGRLGAAVERLLSIAPPEDVHVVYLDDIKAEPERAWHGLMSFLELDSRVRPDFRVRNASDKTFRSLTLRHLTHRPPRLLDAPVRRIRQWSRTTDTTWVARAKHSMWRPESKPSITADLHSEIADVLSADVALLSELTKKDLSHWTPSA